MNIHKSIQETALTNRNLTDKMFFEVSTIFFFMDVLIDAFFLV